MEYPRWTDDQKGNTTNLFDDSWSHCSLPSKRAAWLINQNVYTYFYTFTAYTNRAIHTYIYANIYAYMWYLTSRIGQCMNVCSLQAYACMYVCMYVFQCLCMLRRRLGGQARDVPPNNWKTLIISSIITSLCSQYFGLPLPIFWQVYASVILYTLHVCIDVFT